MDAARPKMIFKNICEPPGVFRISGNVIKNPISKGNPITIAQIIPNMSFNFFIDKIYYN